jgi:hypothetical protein
MLEGDYSPSEFDDEQPSAASHVDLEQVVEVISDLVGADYSAKYLVSSFIEYNDEQYVPSPSMRQRGPRTTASNSTRAMGMAASASAKRFLASRN